MHHYIYMDMEEEINKGQSVPPRKPEFGHDGLKAHFERLTMGFTNSLGSHNLWDLLSLTLPLWGPSFFFRFWDFGSCYLRMSPSHAQLPNSMPGCLHRRLRRRLLLRQWFGWPRYQQRSVVNGTVAFAKGCCHSNRIIWYRVDVSVKIHPVGMDVYTVWILGGKSAAFFDERIVISLFGGLLHNLHVLLPKPPFFVALIQILGHKSLMLA